MPLAVAILRAALFYSPRFNCIVERIEGELLKAINKGALNYK